MTKVRIPPVLRTQVNGNKEVDASGTTVGEVVADLVARYPQMGEQLLAHDGGLHRFVNVYLNGQDVRYLQLLDTPGRRARRPDHPARDGRRSLSVPRRYSSLIDAIGHTPLVEVSRFYPNPNVHLLVKLEGANPTGSVKDRVARYLIDSLDVVRSLQGRFDSSRTDFWQHRHRTRHDLPPARACR